MTNYSGYMGKVVCLDLPTHGLSEYPWSDEERRQFLGGRAMAAKIMSDCTGTVFNALSEESLIVIATGPLTGTGAPCSNHFCISSLSPSTGAVRHSSCGGDFGLFLKKAGYDALIIKGRCEEPTWISIHNDSVTFRSAQGLMGLGCGTTQITLQTETDEKRGCRVKCGMLVIGPAGEKLVNCATVVSGGREAEHCDFGAVFGYKNLKAIVVSGNKEIPLADTGKNRAICRQWSAALRSHPLTGSLLPKLGTMGFLSLLNSNGLLPTENCRRGSFDNAEDIGGEFFADRFNLESSGCSYGPIRCERSAMLDRRPVRGPELELAALLGSNILNSDMGLIVRWSHELLEYGLDAASTANTIAWAMQANEEGIFKSGLEFGRTGNISGILGDIAYKRGVGAELAEGSKKLADKYGGDFLCLLKPLEMTAVEQYTGHIGYADYLRAAAASSGQCRMTDFAAIPKALIRKPNGIASSFLKPVLAASEPLVKLLSRLPDCTTDSLPLFAHTKALDAAVGLRMSLGEYIEVGRRAMEADGALNEKLGAEAEKPCLPPALIRSHREARRARSREELARLRDRLCSIDMKNISAVKLPGRE